MMIIDNSTIVQRWFVMEWDKIRKSQYRALLKRDVIADNYEIIINSPAYIEKATIKNFNDPAIFNKEDLFVNQIKKQEKLLKDKTNMAWLVAWINNNIAQDTWTGLFNHKSVPYTRNIDTGVDYTTDDIATWISSHQLSGTYKCLKESDDYMWFKVQNELADTGPRVVWTWMDYKIYRDRNHEATGGNGGNRSGYGYNFKDKTSFGTMIAQTETINNQLYNAVKSAEGFITGLDSRFSYINKIVKETKDDVNKYYKIEASYTEWNSAATYGSSHAVASLFAGLPNGDRNTVYVYFNGDIVTFSYRDVTNEMATTANIYADVSSVTPRNSGLIDAPYMAVCIPYTLNESLTGEARQDVIADGSSFNARIDSTKAFAAVTLLSYCLQDGQHLYDVQLLPYCPMVNEISITGPYHDSFLIDASKIANNRKIKFYQTDGSTFDTNTPLMEAFVFFNSSFTFDIPLIISDKNTVFEKKLASETELYRFNAPNYSAYFDFNPYMNNGMTKVNVDCTYKPYKSYIHMNPDFKGLYGSDFNDARGLVITSDFSIPQVTDAWQTYQIQNKNYSDIFKRNQQHLEVEQKWQEAEAAMNMFTAGILGGGLGAQAGSKAGPYGAIAGAAIGSIMGTAGGIADYVKTTELNKEALNYNKDMYNFNLQNIQALPQTLSSISSYDANNKLWPFLEIYDCTDVEKEAMRNKLIYNGMKIGRIDTINNFISTTSNYIKAKLIRNEISSLDYHELNDIGLELDKGVFM